MNVKKLVKVANYYDVKYGFKKEADISTGPGGYTGMSSEDMDLATKQLNQMSRQERQKLLDTVRTLGDSAIKKFNPRTINRWKALLDRQVQNPTPALYEAMLENENENWNQTRNRLGEGESPPLGWAESMSKAYKESQDDWGKPRISPYDLKKETDSEILTYLASISNFLASPPDMSDIYSVAPNITSSRAQQLLSKLTSMWTDRKNKTQPSSGSQIGAGNAPKKPAIPFKPNKANWQKFQPRLSEVKQSIDLFLGRNPTSTTLQKQKQRLMFLNQQALSGKDIDVDLKRLESEAIYQTPAKRTKEPDELNQDNNKKDSDSAGIYETAELWGDADKLST